MRRAALQLGILDSPDGQLKNHGGAVPYFGGLAVYLAFLLAVGVFTDFGAETLGLLLSGTIALMVGLIDDFTKSTTLAFKAADEAILLIGETKGWLGQSLYLRDICEREEGAPPPVDLAAERRNGECAQHYRHPRWPCFGCCCHRRAFHRDSEFHLRPPRGRLPVHRAVRSNSRFPSP